MRKYVTPDTLANEIRLEKQARRGVFAVVEGSDDARFYGGFVRSERCFFKISHGRDAAIQTAAKFSGKAGVIAIVDADEYPLLGESIPVSHIFRTDSHDAETMIIQSEAFDKYLRHAAHEADLRRLVNGRGVAHLRDILLAAGRPLGCLRIVSRLKKLRLDFKNLYFGGFLSEADLTVDEEKMVEFVRRNTRERLALDDKQLLALVRDAEQCYESHWYVVCGHDLCQVLCIGLKAIFGHKRYSKTLSKDEVEKDLRLSYELKHFQRSKLYKSMVAWQRQTGAIEFLL